MKSLDINFANTNLNVDASQLVTIEFTGGNHADRMQNGAAAYTVTVPYSSFSKRMKMIHRFGGKITNISIHRHQLDLPKIHSAVSAAKDTENIFEETPLIAIAPTVEIETISEITTKDISVDVPNNIPKDVPESITEVVLPVSTSKVKKQSDISAQPKKSRTSPKASHGFSKKEASHQVQEPVAIAETVTAPEPIVEIILESVAETVTPPEPIVEIIPELVAETVTLPEPIVEIILEPVVEAVTEVISETSAPIAETNAKPKKSKTSTKTSHGFSKKEASPQVQEPVVIAEIVTAPEPIVEIIPEPVVEAVTEPISTQILESVAEASTEAVPNHVTESVAPLIPSKSKKSKTSSKSGSGFNKPKSTTNQASSSSQKPKI